MFGQKYNDNGERQADIDAENMRQREWERGRNNYNDNYSYQNSSTKGLFSGLFSALFSSIGTLFKILGYFVLIMVAFKIISSLLN